MCIRDRSKIGYYKFGVVIGGTPGSKHRYAVKLIGKRNKDGSGRTTIENLPIQNLVLLKATDHADPEPEQILKTETNEQVNEEEQELTAGVMEDLLQLPAPVPTIATPAAAASSTAAAAGEEGEADSTSTADARAVNTSTADTTAHNADAADTTASVTGAAGDTAGNPAATTEEEKPKKKRPNKRHPTYARRKERRAAMRKEGEEGKILQRRDTKFNEVAVTTEDLLTMVPDEELSDGIIDLFGKCVEEKYPGSCYLTMWVMLKMKHDPESAAAFVVGKCPNILRHEILLFPLHLGFGQSGHWVLATLSVEEEEIRTYNSLDKQYKGEMMEWRIKLRRFLQHLHELTYKHIAGDWYRPIALNHFKETAVTCPQQPKQSVDCGVYVCGFMLCAVERQLPAFTQEGILNMRKDIAKIVHKGYI